MTQQHRQVERSGDPEHGIPPLPPWPTSVPGPNVTPPPPGTRHLRIRSDQVIELDYNAEKGKSEIRGD